MEDNIVRNPDSPWNPAKPPNITPEEFENWVVRWLKATSANLINFKVEQLKRLSGSGGDYEFDAIAEFSIFEGAKIQVIIECKRYSRPVERSKLLELQAKKDDVKAHKAMMFATCGFQAGALEYAKEYKIATLTFTKGSFTYLAKAAGPPQEPPPWANIPSYIGIFLTINEEDLIASSSISLDRTDELSEWLLM